MKTFKIALLVLAVCVVAFAQSTSQIQGTVKDASGAAVPDAEVKATQTDTGLTRTVTTGADGGYVLTNLAIGPYRIEVNRQGFSTYVQTGIVLQVATQPTIDVALKVGNVNEQVQVEANAALVETQSTNIGSVIENQRILELPLNGRQATDLIQLAGASVPQGVAGAGGFPGTGNIVIAGGQGNGVGYFLDGSVFNNPWDNANLPFPFPDALQEFKVETSALDAGTGMHAGASINAVTKGGTNQLHGDLFEFIRNNKLNAQNFFTNANPTALKDTLKRNQFGGTIGGRIIKDKLFVFGGYQQTETRQLSPAPVSQIPTKAMQAGDFTACPSAIPASLASNFTNGQLRPGVSFDQASLKLASKLPDTSDPCGRITFSFPTKISEYQVVGRADYIINEKQSLFARYMAVTYYRPPSYELAPNNVLTTGQASLDDAMQSFMLGHTYIASSNIVNSLRAAGNRVAVRRGNADFFSACDLGVQMYCGYVPHQSFFTIPNAFTLGVSTGTKGNNGNTTYQLSDDVSWIHGSHQINFGFLGSFYKLKLNGTVYGQNQYSFPSIAAFLLGGAPNSPVTVTTALPNILDQAKWYMGMYIRDTWKISPRLTVNAGLRWEPFLPPQMVNGAAYTFSQADFIAGKKSSVFTNAPAGFLFPGDAAFPNGNAGVDKKWGMFAPRIGLAWDPTGSGKTSIRASYGLAYDFNNGQLFVNTSSAPPFGNTTIFPAASFTNPWASNPGGNVFPYTVNQNAPFATGGIFIALRPDLKTTAVNQWNLSIQRQLGRDWAVSATYMGSQTSHLWLIYQENPGIYIPGNCIAGQYGLTAPGPCSTNTNTNARRLFSVNGYTGANLIANMDRYDDGGTASYNGLILAVQKRLSRGVSMNANYTWSHCIGDLAVGNSTGNAGSGLVIPNDRRQDRSNCISQQIGGTFSSDRRHLFNMTIAGEAPKFNNRVARTLISGWQAAGIYRFTSAGWLTITMLPADVQFSGTTNQRPVQLAANTLCDSPNSACWISKAAFTTPTAGTLSTMNRSNVPGPNFWQFDLSVTRNFNITERQKIQIRGEAFNLLNSFRAGVAPPSLAAGGSGVVTTFGSGNFGQITSALDPRIIQLAAKYVF